MKTICIYSDIDTYKVLEIILREYKTVPMEGDSADIGIICISNKALETDLSILKRLSKKYPVIALVYTHENDVEILESGASVILRQPFEDNYLKAQIGALERLK